MLRWLSAGVAAVVVTGFAFLLLTGRYINDGPVVVPLTHSRGLHEGDLFVLAGWLLSLVAVAVLLFRPAGRDS